MFTGGGSQVASDVEHLKGDFYALCETTAVLRGTFARNRLIAARAYRHATRTRANTKHLRGELFHVELPRAPAAGGLARRLLDVHLGTHLAEELADAKTVVSELVNNAVIHGRGAIRLRVSRRRGRIRIDVADEGHGATIRAGNAHPLHGLDIVGALSLAWGAREGSTHVWAELAISTPAPGLVSGRHQDGRSTSRAQGG
jgi:hypothetical protein